MRKTFGGLLVLPEPDSEHPACHFGVDALDFAVESYPVGGFVLVNGSAFNDQPALCKSITRQVNAVLCHDCNIGDESVMETDIPL